MKRARIGLLTWSTLVLAAVAGCSGGPVVKTAGISNSLRTLHTYGWMSRDPSAIDNPARMILDHKVQFDVDGYLAIRGYRKTSLETPDFMVGYEWKIGRANADTIGDFFRYRDEGGQKQLVEAYAIGYEEGVFTLEFIDTSTRRMIWQAQAKALVGRDDQPEKLSEMIGAMFHKLEEEEQN